MKAAEAAYQKDLMNNVEVGGHPYSTYNTGKDVQKAVKALDPNRSTVSTAASSYNTPAQTAPSTETYSEADYANYYNQYYSDPNYYYYYQQYYAQYGYYPQQQAEPKTAAELKEEEKNKQREYLEQQMRKYRQPESESAPKQEQAQIPQQYAEALATQQYVQQEAPPPKKADEGVPGEWQEVSADTMYSSYYRPVSPEGDDDDEEQNNKKRPRSDSESSDDDSDNRRGSFGRRDADSNEQDTGAEVVWKRKNTNEGDSRPKKKIRRTII